jgi:4'-phosphopantetheinyl transferase EntD
MLDGLLPPGVVVEHGRSEDASVEPYPEEAVLVERAVTKRKLEFAKGRECARRALERLGVRNFPVLSGPQREPLWPRGIVGSISHTAGLCAAAVCQERAYPGLGIDVEPAEPITADVAARICQESELSGLLGLPDFEKLVIARLVFSAKEAVYKCQFPLSRAFVGFEEVELALDPAGTFRVRWLKQPAPISERAYRMFGRWCRRDGFLLTTAWLEPTF